jgi:hypothetical protein
MLINENKVSHKISLVGYREDNAKLLVANVRATVYCPKCNMPSYMTVDYNGVACGNTHMLLKEDVIEVKCADSICGHEFEVEDGLFELPLLWRSKQLGNILTQEQETRLDILKKIPNVKKLLES